MALMSANGVMYKIHPAANIFNQMVKLRPNEHHYEDDGEEPYIKYSCQLCERLAESAKKFDPGFLGGTTGNEKFVRFSLPKGIKNCPCCGINIDWDYK